MGKIVITPSWVSTFEHNVQTIIQSSWEDTAGSLIWDQLMDVKQSNALHELYFWLLENAGIELQGAGGNARYDTPAAAFMEITNENSGKALTLTRDEIEDNQMSSPALRGMPALDYAARWASDMGYSSAYWPQDRLFGGLLANGETDSGYDDVSFFSAAHPLNVVRGAARGTYANLFTGTAVSGAPATDLSQALYPGACPIDGTNAPTLQAAHDNLARAVAYVESLKGPHLKPRHLKVRFLMAGTALRKRASEVLSTKYFGTGQGSTENVISTWGVEPLIVPEISSLTDYYLVCEWKKGQGGPMVFQNRRAYVLTSYAPETTLTLQRAKKFEWDYNGRNAVAYGHPYYVFKVKAA